MKFAVELCLRAERLPLPAYPESLQLHSRLSPASPECFAMLIVRGPEGKDLCDRQLGPTRRDVLRVGGSGMLGLSLGGMFQLKAAQAAKAEVAPASAPGWDKAKSVILVYLQGGPSHLDLWDPKENVPDNVRSDFNPIATKLPGRAIHRTAAEAGAGERQVHDDPLDELHAQRAVQPHGRHLSDDDRLHDRQGQPVRPVGTARSQRTSPTSARTSFA